MSNSKKTQTASTNPSRYTLKELSKAAKTLGVAAECVEAALLTAGVKEATLAEAQKIVNNFMSREVK